MPKVLIADDNQYLRILLTQILEELEDRGVTLITTHNGEEALDIIKRERPEVVFLDVMMPKMNGFDVCHTVKHKLAIRNVHIVLLTVKGQVVDKQKGKDMGADTYITKPYDPDEVLKMVKNILGM